MGNLSHSISLPTNSLSLFHSSSLFRVLSFMTFPFFPSSHADSRAPPPHSWSSMPRHSDSFFFRYSFFFFFSVLFTLIFNVILFHLHHAEEAANRRKEKKETLKNLSLHSSCCCLCSLAFSSPLFSRAGYRTFDRYQGFESRTEVREGKKEQQRNRKKKKNIIIITHGEVQRKLIELFELQFKYQPIDSLKLWAKTLFSVDVVSQSACERQLDMKLKIVIIVIICGRFHPVVRFVHLDLVGTFRR